jgi:diguanylate cyclase (GGDEF)-like protein
MKLRARVLTSLLLTALSGLALMYVVMQTVMMGGYLELERTNQVRNVARVIELMNESGRQLSLKVTDLSTWDDTYRFIEDLNPEFIKGNMGSNFAALGIDHLLMLKPDGSLRYSRGADGETGEPAEVPAQIIDHAARALSRQNWRHHTEDHISYVAVGDRIFLTAMRPMVNTDMDLPIRGTLLYTREVGPKVLESYSRITGYDVSIEPIGPARLREMLDREENPFAVRVDQSDARTIVSRVAIPGADRVTPLFDVVVSSERTMLARGQSLMRIIMTASALMCGLIAGAAILLVDLIIVRRVERVTRIVEATRSLRHTGFIDGLRTSGQDEIDRASKRIYELHTEALRLADFDELTGVRNSRFFKSALDRHLEVVRRHRKSAGLILIDLDFFKRVNDTRGHIQGDAVLKAVGELLQRRVRGSDVAGRYGGEEFAVLLSDTDESGAMAAAESLRAAIESLVIEPTSAGPPLHITASLGVAMMTQDSGRAEEVLAACDRALYRAKGFGRNRVVLAPPAAAR